MSPERNGNFTSSEIAALMKNGKEKGTFGVPALTYIEECNMERRLGRCLDNELDSRPTTWGNLCEGRVFFLLPTSYKLVSNDTLDHPEIEFWKGSPDAQKFDEGNTIVDIKCPQTLKSFCQLVDAWTRGGINEIRSSHLHGEKYYWQLVSNAILTNSKYAELIVYAPYKSELEAIREMAYNFDSIKQHKFMWIALAADDELPYLPDGGHYKNINIMRFPVPAEDKIALHNRVIEAGKMLVRRCAEEEKATV